MTMTGVTVGGQPAAIDESGIHVGGSSNSAKPLTDAVNTLLKSIGATLTVASTSGDVKNENPKQVSSEVQGLVFHIEQFLNIPNNVDTYFANFTLGIAGTTAVAASDRASSPPAEEGGIGGVTEPSSPDQSSALPSGAPASFDAGTPGTPGSSFANTTTRRAGRPAVLGSRRSALSQLEADLAGLTMAHRFDLLYLAFALAFAGVCLSSRLLVPRARRIS
jgi:hypothetical protein